jgi:hypothetical protein
MKDITLLFCIALLLVLGLTSLDGGLEKARSQMAANATIGLPGFYATHATARSLAQQEPKPIVLVFGRPADPVCQAFKTNVLLSSDVQAIRERFIWVFVDADQPINAGTIQTFEAITFPTCRVLNERDQVVSRPPTDRSTYDFARELRQLIAQPASTPPQ